MYWIIGVVTAIFVVPRLLRRRQEVPVLPGQPISTLHSAWERRTSKETKAALEAAGSLLR
jgi:hypothetical protein